MVFSLEQLGRHQEAVELARQFKRVAESRQDANEPFYIARATYLRGLIVIYAGDTAEGMSAGAKIDHRTPRERCFAAE
jgi:hypothetical protein